MEYPYMPVGEIDHEAQKRNVIKHAIDLLNRYEEDESIKQVIVSLKEYLD
jgi:P2-related tail formation protein